MGFFSELRRRNVLRMGIFYAVSAWLVMQVAEVIIGLASLPEWVGKAVLAMLAIGFPIALILAWVFEFTSKGIVVDEKRPPLPSPPVATSRRMDFVIIAVLAAAVILFAYEKWWWDKEPKDLPPPANTIAVLAFANMSPDPDQEFFSDGVSEELLNLLAQVPELKVIARTSSFSFKGEKADIATIAERLNVRHVVEGSVRRSGDKVRITAQLIDTTDSSHVWSQNYDRNLNDIFGVQDQIARAIVESLKLRLTIDTATELLTVPRATSVEAYETYLLGRHQLNERGSENLDSAIASFQKAIELDPGFAAAYADQAIAILLLASPTDEHPPPPEASIARARLLVDHAMALAPESWEVLAAAGKVEEVSENFELAMEYYDRSLAINPSNGESHIWRMGDEVRPPQFCRTSLVHPRYEVAWKDRRHATGNQAHAGRKAGPWRASPGRVLHVQRRSGRCRQAIPQGRGNDPGRGDLTSRRRHKRLVPCAGETRSSRGGAEGRAG
jgi:TolB-like protein